MKSSLENLRVVVFESSLRENFRPLSFTRPTFDFLLGSCTKIQRIEKALGVKVTDAIVPKYLERITREEHPLLRVNDEIDEECLAVNALLSSRYDLGADARSCPPNVTITDPSTNLPVLARLDSLDPRTLARMNNRGSHPASLAKQRTTSSNSPNPPPLLYYPWQLFEENSHALAHDYSSPGHRPSRSVKSLRDCEAFGTKFQISGRAEIGRYVTLDSRGGPVIIDDGAIIQSFTHLTGPCYIGPSSIVKSARIREGTSIGAHCRVSGEIEESIFFDYSNKNHDGFIGHSVVGSWVNLGALTTNSDLKNTYGRVKVSVGGESVDTGSIKVGIFIGDMAKSAVGSVIYSGKKVGVSSHIFGTVIEDVPSFTFFAKSLGALSREIYLESAIETQRRMMARRNFVMSEARVELLKALFEMTSKERSAAKVSAGRFELG